MKAAGIGVAMAAMACIALQGCAGTGGLTYAKGAAPNAAPTTVVGSSGDKAVVRADTKEEFEAIVAAIQKQMAPGGRWQYVGSRERSTIDGSFADMGKLYDRFGSVAKMDQAAKVRLLADQSTVNAILTKRDGDRLICTSELPVGSHLPVRTCKTYAQLQAEQRNTQRQLMQLDQQNDIQKVGGH